MGLQRVPLEGGWLSILGLDGPPGPSTVWSIISQSPGVTLCSLVGRGVLVLARARWVD